MKKPRKVECLLLVLPIVGMALLYGSIFPKYFQSETFVLLSYLDRIDLITDVSAAFTSYHFGNESLGYYRPLFDLFMALLVEAARFEPIVYNITGLVIHCTNVLLVVGISNLLIGSDERWKSYVAGSMFALYPLTPNAVVFVAANATPLATMFMLFSLYFHVRTRRGWTISFAASVFFFALSLWTYEAAIVLPLLVFLSDVFRFGFRFERKQITRYFVLSTVVFGYLVYRDLALGGFPLQHVEVTDHILQRIYQQPGFLWRTLFPDILEDGVERAGSLLLAVTLLLFVWFRIRSAISDSRWPTLMFFGIAWVFICSLTSPEIDVQPAGGRYVYIASIGVALGIAGALPDRPNMISLALPLLLLIFYSLLLNRTLDLYASAGRLTAQIQEQLVTKAVPGTMTLVGNYPYFLKGNGNNRIAQVFHWGLSDAASELFSGKQLRIYPAGNEVDLTGLRFPGTDILVWNDENNSIERMKPVQQNVTGSIEVRFWPENLDLQSENPAPFIIFETGDLQYYRVVILSKANPIVSRLDLQDATSYEELRDALIKHKSKGYRLADDILDRLRPHKNVIVHHLPYLLLLDYARVYPDTIYFWVEGLDENKQTIARSELFPITVTVDR